MSENTTEATPKINDEITALKDLIAVIVDYYCFKNGDYQEEEGDGSDDNDAFWKKHLLNKDSENELNSVIPEDIDILISDAFKFQLQKFSR